MDGADSPEEICHVDIVRQGRRQAHNSDETLRRFDLAERPRDDRLDDRSTIFMQQVHLVDDEKLDFLWAHGHVSKCARARTQLTGPLTSATSLSLLPAPRLVTTSHFSGVVTMIAVSSTSFFVSFMSPVNSRTLMPAHESRLANLSVTSAARALRGAT